MPTTSTVLNYHGQQIDVNVEHFDVLRVLGQGCYGTVLAVGVNGHPDIRMAVKVENNLDSSKLFYIYFVETFA